MQNQITATTRKIVNEAKFVNVDIDSIVQVCSNISAEGMLSASSNLNIFKWKEEEAVWIIFLFNCINFSYWPDKGNSKWGFMESQGSSALFKAIEYAVKSGAIKLDATWISKINRDQFEKILGEDKGLPMIDERLMNLLIAGQVLDSKYNGSPINLIKKVKNNAAGLADELAYNFSFFCDVGKHNGFDVWFLKRAQLMSKMLKDYFNGEGIGHFKDMDKLTLFADYRLPQILNTLGILVYSTNLEEKLSNEVEILSGSPEEIEIRAATVQAGELMKLELAKKIPSITCANIDTFLWLKSRNLESRLPHHRTRTIYY